MRALSEDLDVVERQVLDDIAEHGCHIAVVDEPLLGPAYAYSVGLWHRFQQPEIVIVGLPAEVAEELIALVGEDAEAGKRHAEGAFSADLLHGYRVTFRSVPRSHLRGWLAAGVWAYEGDDFPVLQLVWPDKQGRYPWQPGVREGFAALQPLLASQPAVPGGDDQGAT